MPRQSYFEEQKRSNANFQNRLTVSDIRKNVKRILRDIKYGNILDADYQYFMNEKILTACIEECYEQANNTFVISNALYSYVTEILNNGGRMHKSEDINTSRNIAIVLSGMYTERYYTWSIAYSVFFNLRYWYCTDINFVKNYLVSQLQFQNAFKVDKL